MAYVHKAHSDMTVPRQGERVALGLARAYGELAIVSGDRLYLFREDRKPRDGGLIARGTVINAVEEEPRRWRFEAEFDGCEIVVPLPTCALDRFKKNGSHDTGPFVLPLMTEIAELRRNTTHQPIHAISEEAADWLDLYHFQEAERG